MLICKYKCKRIKDKFEKITNAESSKNSNQSTIENFINGLIVVGPIIATTYLVGGFWEVVFAVVRKHEINEGFLVTGFLIPLTMPPTVPLWMLAIATIFGVVIGKEILWPNFSSCFKIKDC